MLNEPVVFVATGKPVRLGEFWMSLSRLDFSLVQDDDRSTAALSGDWPGYRRLPPGWLAGAVERLRQLDWARFREEGDMLLAGPNDVEIVAALFPPPEEPPPEWAIRAAHTLGHAAAHEDEHARNCEKCMAWARIIAKHAAKGVS